MGDSLQGFKAGPYVVLPLIRLSPFSHAAMSHLTCLEEQPASSTKAKQLIWIQARPILPATARAWSSTTTTIFYFCVNLGSLSHFIFSNSSKAIPIAIDSSIKSPCSLSSFHFLILPSLLTTNPSMSYRSLL